MKRLVMLLPLLLCLCGCSGLVANLPLTEPTPPPVLGMPSPEERPAPTWPEPAEPSTTEPASTEPLTPDPAPPESTPTEPSTTEPPTAEPTPSELPTEEPTPTEPSTPEPSTPTPTPSEPPQYQSGDTTPTWRPELAERYPADVACGAALLLEKWMAVEGLTMDDLEERDCRQLLLVVAQPPEGVAALAVCYDCTAAGDFRPVAGLDGLRGFVGKNGIKHDRRRDSLTSPAGLWAISWAFGNAPPPENLKLPWRQVTPNSDWVCDEASPYFNTWQERGEADLLPWSDDVEHLEDYPSQYAWACVIEFNRPPDAVPNRGCAIFLHCSEGGTGGCVGLPRAAMLSVLGWLDADKNPCILITGIEAP